jgi:SAM-dependent methyltransferase
MIEQTTSRDENWIPSVRALLSKYYPDYGRDRFVELLSENIRSSDRVLEIGAGSGKNHQNHFNLRGKVARYVGVDLDPSVLTNPFLDESYCAGAESLPFESETFNIVFHNYVAEHFVSPLACNREIGRVLKKAGLLLFQTPSRYAYSSLVASVTPHWFHGFYVRHFGSGRSESEIFPTFYRLNDRKTITAQLQSCGFQCEIEYRSVPPGYLRFNKFAFLAGVFYERTFERRFLSLRGRIIVLARKK